MSQIDLNCDIGELEGEAGLRLDSAILQLVTSANVACGAHAGDATRMRQLAVLCRCNAVAFGAHPGYPDRRGFGRQVMAMPVGQISQMVLEQVTLAMEIADSEGIPLSHVKPHGALYNVAARDLDVAMAIAESVRRLGSKIRFVGLAGSQLIEAGKLVGLVTVSEVFADRAYHSDGSLVSRENPRAVLHDVEQIIHRAAELIQSQSVISIEGEPVKLHAETICVHGDTVGAVEITRQLHALLESKGIAIRHG